MSGIDLFNFGNGYSVPFTFILFYLGVIEASQDNHFSYFNNLSRFIYLRDLSLLCDTHETICKQQKDISAEIKRYENVPETRKIFEGVPYKIETCHKEMDKLQRQKEVMETIMNLYGQHYEKAYKQLKN